MWICQGSTFCGVQFKFQETASRGRKKKRLDGTVLPPKRFFVRSSLQHPRWDLNPQPAA